MHHRLFLSNTTADVEMFAVHFGYSYVLAGRAWRLNGFVLHASGGAIVTSPESRIRGKGLNTSDPDATQTGYGLSGVGGSLAVSRRLQLSRHVSLIGDLAVLAAHASVPVADGTAKVPNVGIHGRVGVAFGF